ncbi:MAG: radical SAM family heme chaperone HemW [Wenzhouxiangellaceae bacterium]
MAAAQPEKSGMSAQGLTLQGMPPLALYVHLPWCVRKCPYCDFNSHPLHGELPAEAYVDALLADLDQQLPLVWGRVLHSIFFGGGTPSLFSGAQIERFLDGVRARMSLAPAAEITLEANPGTVEHDHFAAYRAAGVNRVSLGVQSFADAALQQLGRIHGGQEAITAIDRLRQAGFDNFNIDLMYGLPQQDVAAAVDDVQRALAFAPTHVSHYQLTLEPNTLFAHRPPPLPDEDIIASMQEACADHLQAAGLRQYEVSAWSQPQHECRHNLNYWRFGDYLAVGAGAHGKLTLPAEQAIVRYVRQPSPKRYLQAMQSGEWDQSRSCPDARTLVFEFFLNALRLRDGVDLALFRQRTGLTMNWLQQPLDEAQQRGLVWIDGDDLHITDLGWRFLNDLQAIFLPA